MRLGQTTRCNAEQETKPIHLKLLLQNFSRAQALRQSLDLDQDIEDGRALHRAAQTAYWETATGLSAWDSGHPGRETMGR